MKKVSENAQAQAVKETVRTGYSAIATGQHFCCSSQRNSQAYPTRLAHAVGYDAESLANLPEGADMGLSCGNPIAITALKERQIVLDLGSGGAGGLRSGRSLPAVLRQGCSQPLGNARPCQGPRRRGDDKRRFHRNLCCASQADKCLMKELEAEPGLDAARLQTVLDNIATK